MTLPEQKMIRNATVDDVEKLAALKAKVGRETYYDYGTPEQFDAWVDSVCTPEYFEAKINNCTTVIVAEYEDVLLGMGSVGFQDDKALFSDLYIGLQGRGIGSLLTQHRLSLVESHVSLMPPHSTFDVEALVFYQNHRAYAHCLKHGFLPYDYENHHIYKTPLVIFRQTLTP